MDNLMPGHLNPPFIAIDFPVDEDGNGPVDSNAADVIWQVWDSTNETVCNCNEMETAEWIAGVLNQCAEAKR